MSDAAVCVRVSCQRAEGTEFVTLSDGTVRRLCAECVREFQNDAGVEEALRRKMRAMRRLDIRMRALAGPAADVEAADVAGLEVEAANADVGVAIQGWLVRPRAEFLS